LEPNWDLVSLQELANSAHVSKRDQFRDQRQHIKPPSAVRYEHITGCFSK
jgi:hypothetical protein